MSIRGNPVMVDNLEFNVCLVLSIVFQMFDFSKRDNV